MSLRIVIVLFMVSLTLLSGGSADATTITRTFKLAINEFQILSGSAKSDLWVEKDVFDFSVTYDDQSTSRTQYYNGNNYNLNCSAAYSICSDALISIDSDNTDSYLDRTDFGLNAITGGIGFYKTWFFETTAGDETIAFARYNQNYSAYETITLSNASTSNWEGTFLFSSGNQKNRAQIHVVSAPVPEPSTMILLGSGLVGLVVYRKKRRG